MRSSFHAVERITAGFAHQLVGAKLKDLYSSDASLARLGSDKDLFVCHYVQWTPQTDVYWSLDGVHKSYTTPEKYQGESCRLYRNEGDGRFTDVTDRAGEASPGVLGEETLVAHSGRTADQAQYPPADVRKDPIGNTGIKFSEALFGDARLRPEDSFRMSEMPARDIATPIGEGLFRRGFKTDFLRRSVFADPLEDRLANQSIGRPAAEFDFADEARRGPANALFSAGRKAVPEAGF